jgi:hypothetical protein
MFCFTSTGTSRQLLDVILRMVNEIKTIRKRGCKGQRQERFFVEFQKVIRTSNEI